MKELAIHYFSAKGATLARVRVSYRKANSAYPQEWETDFKFTVTDEVRRLIQWYLEEYLLFPWGEFRNRAQQVEALMEQLGEDLFDAIFCVPEALALYEHVADDLANTRIIIYASDPEGIVLPWELIRDRTRGDLADQVNTFVRSQHDLIFEGATGTSNETTLNILMVICRPGGEGNLPFQSVARPLLELFRPYRDYIHLDVLRPPTLEQLRSVLTEKPNFYHVLHFDGHGVFPQGTGRFYVSGTHFMKTIFYDFFRNCFA